MDMELNRRIAEVQEKIAQAAARAGRRPEEITLCAATKTQSDDVIRQAVAAGVRVCGENRVQELTAHLERGAYGPAQVHFIGHLQRNKVRQVVGRVALIASVDGEELLRRIDSQARSLGLAQDILLEVNLGEEAGKTGLLPRELSRMAELAGSLEGIRLRGLMGMAPKTSQVEEIRPFFALGRKLYIDIREKRYDNKSDIVCLSMGMSGDFQEAILEGANLVRVGTALFGARPLPPGAQA